MAKQSNEALELVAPFAAEGYRGLILVGKVKTAPTRRANQTTGEITIKADVISGEGDTITVKWPGTEASLPGVGHEGAFLLDQPREYMNKASANCIAWL